MTSLRKRIMEREEGLGRRSQRAHTQEWTEGEVLSGGMGIQKSRKLPRSGRELN